MATKSTRYVDEIGRIVIPAHIRSAMKLNPGNSVEVYLAEDGTVRIKASKERCSICGNDIGISEDTIRMKDTGARVCMFCAHEIVKKVKED